MGGEQLHNVIAVALVAGFYLFVAFAVFDDVIRRRR